MTAVRTAASAVGPAVLLFLPCCHVFVQYRRVQQRVVLLSAVEIQEIVALLGVEEEEKSNSSYDIAMI